MAPTLDIILRNLQTNENRLAFLNKIYRPGNSEVADYILSISPDSAFLIEKEMAYATEHGGPKERIEAMGCKLVDYHINNNFDILRLRDAVLKWGNKQIADYAISRLTEKGNEVSLEYAAQIASEFGRENEGRQLLEKVFDLQIKRSESKHPFIPARTAVTLGKFDDAITLYLKAGYSWLDNAFKVAQEHAPERVTEIATKIFNDYSSDKYRGQELYLESARILGKEGKAERVLKKEAEKLQVDREPRFYGGLVKALVSLRLNDEARSVAEKVEAYELEKMHRKEFYDRNGQKELADIFLALGDTQKAAQVYLRNIERGLSRNGSIIFMSDIDAVYELTGDKSVLEKKRFLFEQEGKYDKAAGLSRELGRTDLAEIYDTMQEMVLAVQTPQK